MFGADRDPIAYRGRAVAGLAIAWLVLAGLAPCLCTHAGHVDAGDTESATHSCCPADVGSPHRTGPVAPHRGENRVCEHCRPASGRIENWQAPRAGWGTATLHLATGGVQSPLDFASPASLIAQPRARTGPAPALFPLTRALRI